MPDRRGVDHQVAAGRLVGRAHPARPGRPARRRPRPAPAVRLTTTTSAAPASARRGDHRPGRSAGTHHQAARALRGRSRPRGAGRPRSPAPSVLSPSHEPPSSATQLTAPSRAGRRGREPADRGGHVLLVGHGHREAAHPEGPGAGQGRAAWPGRHREARPTPSRGRARRRPCCAAGATASGPPGSPITPTTRGGRRQPGWRPSSGRSGAVIPPVSTGQPSPRWSASASLASCPA